MARRFHRTRHHLSNATRGAKGSAISLATGAGIGAASGYAFSAIPFLATNWWAMPAATALIGHFLKRKNPVIGDALIGTAGFLLYSAYMANKSSATTKGFIDAGAMLPGSSDAGALFGASSYNDSRMTDASPAMGTAQAAMLMDPTRLQRSAGAGEFIDAGDAMGLSD